MSVYLYRVYLFKLAKILDYCLGLRLHVLIRANTQEPHGCMVEQQWAILWQFEAAYGTERLDTLEVR